MYKVTHSLLSSWLYSIQEDPYEDATKERDLKAEFLTVLRREPTPTTEAMQNGIDFENLVTDILSGKQTEHKWQEAAAEVAGIVGPAVLQASCGLRIGDWYLYGRPDAIRAGTIYDIKFSEGYDRGKYLDSTQHPMYLRLLPEADRFVYVVSNGTNVWTEEYWREDVGDIMDTVNEFAAWLKVMGLEELYREKWKCWLD